MTLSSINLPRFLKTFIHWAFTTSSGNEFPNLIIYCMKKYFLWFVFNLLPDNFIDRTCFLTMSKLFALTFLHWCQLFSKPVWTWAGNVFQYRQKALAELGGREGGGIIIVKLKSFFGPIAIWEKKGEEIQGYQHRMGGIWQGRSAFQL